MQLDHRVDITIDLIHRITGLSKTRANPTTHFVGKDQDKKLAAQFIKKYNLTRGGQHTMPHRSRINHCGLLSSYWLDEY